MIPGISVVTPCYNVAAYLPSFLAGILEQTVPRSSYEVILVDNNSTDDTIAIARHCDGVRLLHQPVQGSYAARNLGVARAQGALIAFVDPDCRPDPTWLATFVAAMEDPACTIALGGRRFAAGSGVLALVGAYDAHRTAAVVARERKELYYGYTNNMGVRRELFERIGPFSERPRGGDTMFVRKAVDLLGPSTVRYVPAMGVTHLEITGMREYWRKNAIYGRSSV